MSSSLLLLWGKTSAGQPGVYHPLLFHMLDVGHVAHVIWDLVLPASTRSRIAAALGLSVEETERLVALLAAQHDLGKASAFQLKAPELCGWVSGTEQPPRQDAEQPHNVVTAAVLPDLAAGGIGGWRAPRKVAGRLAQITGGHHGRFPTARDMEFACSTRAVGGPAWDALRTELLAEAARLLFPGAPIVELDAARKLDAALVPLLAGLISVADWIGSSTTYFPAAGPIDPVAYATRSRKAAREALEQIGWTPRPTFAAPAPFGALFADRATGQAFEPNALQSEVIGLCDAANDPYLLVVEGPMGEGKTEAGLYAVDRALTTGLAHGFYVAMPSMATGNAMFARVLDDYLDRTEHNGRLNVQLVHGGSFLSDLLEDLRLAASEGGPDSEGRLVAEEWFMPKKQALLAPFGVGTIDQSLLSVLQTNHWFVRLFGLAGKIVVFDEVHAYDVYMTDLLKRLLEWLHALGSTVVLMSATLPASRRHELIGAWGAEPPVEEASYPRLTMAQSGAARSAGVTGTSRRERHVSLSEAPTDLQLLATRLDSDLPNGGCAVVICNTVARAQEAYRALEGALGEHGWRVMLHHARTCAEWRKQREEEVLALFGKGGQRPQRVVLVGTQVLEQSLDYDADWMASELAPVDLLLQRMGRLWRHERRSRPVDCARFVVLADRTHEGVAVVPRKTPYWVERYLLLRTALAVRESELASMGLLADDGRLVLPEAIEPLVSAVYDRAEPQGLSESWVSALREAEADLANMRQEHDSLAESCLQYGPGASIQLLLEPGSGAGKAARHLYDEDDPTIHETMRAATRLGDLPVHVVCTGTDADGGALASGEAPALLGDYRAAVKHIVGYGLPISAKVLRKALLDLPTPAAWRRDRYLRRYRELRFDNGRALVAGHVLRLSKSEGLVIDSASEADDS